MGMKWRFQWGWHGAEMGAIMRAGKGVVMRDGIEASIGLKCVWNVFCNGVVMGLEWAPQWSLTFN